MRTKSESDTHTELTSRWTAFRAKSRELHMAARRRELERYKSKRVLEFLAECQRDVDLARALQLCSGENVTP